MEKRLTTPISEEDIKGLKIGDKIFISGYIYCGRDAVLPKIVKLIENGQIKDSNIELEGSLIFHTAVSPAGIGPTSSNKLEIESSIVPLSTGGVKIHLGKGKIKNETVEGLKENNSVFAIIPPVTALLESKTIEREVIAFHKEGMEAFWRLKVEDYPIIIASAHGKTIYTGK